MRLTPEIGDASEDMDDGSEKNIKALKMSALEYIMKHSAELDKVIYDLLSERALYV